MSSASPSFNVGGLASGLDTNAIVSQLMTIEARPKVRLQQKVQVEQARQSALQDVQTRLRNLSLSLAGIRDTSTWGDVQSVDSTDSTKVGVKRVGGAAAGGYSLLVTSLARAAQATQGTAATAASGADTLRITVGSSSPKTVDVAIAAGDTLAQIAEKINGTSDVPVYASVVSGKLVLSGKETGSDKTITVADGDTGNGTDLATELGFTQTQAPLNADFTLDGTRYTNRSSNVVADLLPGVELTLKASTGASTVGINIGAPAPDTATITAKVQAFVDQYNSTIDFIRSKLNEEKVANPQTAADRTKGVLRGDPGISALLDKLRSSLSSAISGAPADLDRLADVGITGGALTGAINRDAVGGKLAFDAAKLTEKLASSFGDVKKLFTNVTNVETTEGLSQRFDRLLDPWLKGVGDNAPLLTSRIDQSKDTVTSLQHSMTDLDQRLAIREKALRAKFTAMEAALQSAQSQSQWLSGQLAAL
ncbi:MAG: flagellar filament capping protein FliD [Gaiellales bacterium]